MYVKLFQSYFRFLLIIFFINLADLSYCQSTTVKSKKVFFCTVYVPEDKVDTFSTPDLAVDHYITKHMPTGFKLKPGTIEVLDNGWVTFTTNKNGQQEASQSGHVLGHILCPPDSWVPYEGSFYAKECHCNQGLIAYGDSCMLQEEACAKKSPLTEEQKVLKDDVLKQLKEIVDKENELLSKDLSRAKEVGGKVILEKGELEYYGKIFYAGYGQALERLTARVIENDPILSKLLKHVDNKAQMVRGGGPDFKGIGNLPNTFEIDITTPQQVEIKKKKDSKMCYEFITYKRLTDKDGNPIEEK